MCENGDEPFCTILFVVCSKISLFQQLENGKIFLNKKFVNIFWQILFGMVIYSGVPNMNHFCEGFVNFSNFSFIIFLAIGTNKKTQCLNIIFLYFIYLRSFFPKWVKINVTSIHSNDMNISTPSIVIAQNRSWLHQNNF